MKPSITLVTVFENHGLQYWYNAFSGAKQNRIQEVRNLLAHLTENKDWFFIEEGLVNLLVGFKSPKDAMMFKLSITW